MGAIADLTHEVRDSSVLLAEMIGSVMELESLRDDEWDYVSEHGHNRDCWSSDEEKNYQEIVDDIQKVRRKVQDLAREATGDEHLEI